MRPWIAFWALALGACTAETWSPASPDRLETATSSVQGGTLGAPLDSMIAVRLLDTEGRPMPGVAVEWSVVSGGATLGVHSTTTDPTGAAYATGTLGYGPEPQVFRVVAPGVAPLLIRVETPVAAFIKIAVGNSFACGLALDSLPWCWGYGGGGMLGADTIDWSVTPRLIGAGMLKFADLALGDDHGCGRTAGGEVWCWGYRWYGRLGDGPTTGSSATPVRPAGLPPVVSIETGGMGTCGLTAGGDLWCWGLVAGTPQAVPALLFPATFRAVALGDYFGCGIRLDDSVACWGQNGNGELGQGTVGGNSAALVPLAAPISATAIDASAFGACAIASGGDLYCWGAMNGMPGHDWSEPGRGTPTVAFEYSPARRISLGWYCGAVWQAASGPKLLCPRGWMQDIESLVSITDYQFGYYTLCLQALGGVTLCKNYSDMIDPIPFSIRGVAIRPAPGMPSP